MTRQRYRIVWIENTIALKDHLSDWAFSGIYSIEFPIVTDSHYIFKYKS